MADKKIDNASRIDGQNLHGAAKIALATGDLALTRIIADMPEQQGYQEMNMRIPQGMESSMVWDYLTPEQQDRAHQMAEALSEMPLLKNRGVKPDDFLVLKTGAGQNLRHTLVYAQRHGLDLRGYREPGQRRQGETWEEIMDDPAESFELEFDGATYDLREYQTYDRLSPLGMTKRVRPLTSEEILLTGQELGEGRLKYPVIAFNNGNVRASWAPETGTLRLLFRPALDLDR